MEHRTHHDRRDLFDRVESIELGRGGDPHRVEVHFRTAGSEPLPHTLARHSPTGFAWGYGGSGPADLALNVLLLFVDAFEAEHLYQAFKWDFVAPARPHTLLRATAIRAWIDTKRAERFEREHCRCCHHFEHDDTLGCLRCGDCDA